MVFGGVEMMFRRGAALKKNEKRRGRCGLSLLVGSNAVFSHQFLEDLEKLWNLQHIIPDPSKPMLLPNKIHTIVEK